MENSLVGTTETRKNYNKRLLKITAKGLTIDRTKDGYGYKYAPLDEIVALLKPELEDVGLSYVFKLQEDKIIINVYEYDSGSFVETSDFPIKNANTNQDLGKAITYGKRYLLKTVFNVSEVNDIDDEDLNKEAVAAGQKKTTVLPKAKLPQDNFFRKG